MAPQERSTSSRPPTAGCFPDPLQIPSPTAPVTFGPFEAPGCGGRVRGGRVHPSLAASRAPQGGSSAPLRAFPPNLLTALTVAARPRALCSPPEARGAALPLKGAVGKGRERRPVGAAARGGAGAPPGGLSCCTHGGTQ